MHSLIPILITALPSLVAGKICPLLGPAFPAASKPVGSSALTAAREEVLGRVQELMQSPALDPDTLSFTLQVFSAKDSQPLIEYYQTATVLKNSTVGVKKVDEDTVFRIASCSKVWAVLVLLIERGDACLYEPVAKYVPEIRHFVAELKRNATMNEDLIDYYRWDEVTIGELASQMAGMERQNGLGDFSFNPNATDFGFPSLPPSDVPECSVMPACNRRQFFEGLSLRHPIVPTSGTPIYSNDAFQLLGYALEGMTGKSFSTLVQEDLIEPLGLTHSSPGKPDDSLGAIPGDPVATAWDIDIGDGKPAGGIYSSTKDLSTLGRAILNHDLLSPALTRRWLKRMTHSADLSLSVGTPWEIFSLTEPRTIDLYTKAGDFVSYSAMMGLSPDHNAGFTILAAGPAAGGTSLSVSLLADIMATVAIPALDNAAKEEALERFGGTYALAGAIKSSISIITDNKPGLKVDSWISNSTDMVATMGSLLVGVRPEDIDIRLYPTRLESPGHISFRSVVSSTVEAASDVGPITGACKSWIMVEAITYGQVGVDEFVFEIDGDGNAVSVSPRAFRVSLPRLEG